MTACSLFNCQTAAGEGSGKCVWFGVEVQGRVECGSVYIRNCMEFMVV